MARATQSAARGPFRSCCLGQILLLCCSALAHAAAAGSDNGVANGVSREVGLRKQLDAVLAQQKVVQQGADELKQRKARLEEDLKFFRSNGFDERPPYPLSMVDQLRDELEGEEARAENTEAAVSAGTEAVEKASKAYDQKQAARRLAKEAANTNSNAAAAPELAAALALAELESQLADETLKLREAELANQKLAEQIQQLVLTFLQEKLALASEGVQFTDSDLQARLAELEALEVEITRAIQLAELNKKHCEDCWTDARNRLDTATDNRPKIAEEAEAWRLARQEGQEELAVLNKRLQRLAEMQTAWTRRFRVLGEEVPGDELRLWQTETQLILEQLQRDQSLRSSQADQIRKDLATINTKLENANGASPELSPWINQQRQHLEGLLKLYDTSFLSIESSQRLHRRLLGELRQDVEYLSPSEWLQGGWRILRGVSNYELVNLDDRPITVAKFFGGLILFFVGLWLSRFLSRLLEIRLRLRGKVNRDAAAVFKTLAFYTLLILFTLLALRIVNVPLTAFAFVGGALAIGFGLGSQNLVNNFLSGLVIMAERPLRLGERVVYGGYDGKVEEVGYRCTRVRTFAGHLVTIPNSNILNEAVENIGRRPYIRRLFNVTVTYDTPRPKIEEAVQILHDVLDEEGIREQINPVTSGDEHPPRVYFNEFNPDSLNILVIYWFAPPDFWGFCEHSQKVNLRIVEEFGKAGIDFAFPTQTLHLAGDPKRELALRLLDGQAGIPTNQATGV